MKPILKIILFLPLVLIINQSNAQKKTLNEYYQDAVKNYQDKDYKNYLINTKEMYAIRDNHPTVLKMLAKAYALNKQESDALNILNQLLIINADTSIKNDPDFINIKESKAFNKYLKKINTAHKPIKNSVLAFSLPEKDLHAEAITYNSITESFFVSSIHKRKIIEIKKDGTIKDFTSQKQDGLWGVSGLKVDQNNKLWVTTSVLPQMIDYDTTLKEETAVFKYDIKSQKLEKKYILSEKEGRHMFGDLIIDKSGNVFMSDSYSPKIYKIENGSDQIKEFITYKNWRSVQGLVFSEDEKYLFIADYTSTLFRIETKSKKILKLNPPKGVSLKGTDGLYFKNNSLITTQNGIRPMQVAQFFLNKDFSSFKSFKILEKANPVLNEPTLGTFVGNIFYYVANSSWGKYDRDGNLLTDELDDNVLIYKVKVK